MSLRLMCFFSFSFLQKLPKSVRRCSKLMASAKSHCRCQTPKEHQSHLTKRFTFPSKSIQMWVLFESLFFNTTCYIFFSDDLEIPIELFKAIWHIKKHCIGYIWIIFRHKLISKFLKHSPPSKSTKPHKLKS